MAWPTIFANLAAGNQPLSLFDAMFNQVAQMVAIPSTPSGSNAITLSPIGNAPTLSAYQNFSSFRFVAGATTTAPVTAQYQALGFLNVYLADGVTQASTGNIVINQEYVLVFAQFLNAGAGGFFLEAASVAAITPVAGSALTNLALVNNSGTPNTQVNVTYDELVMNNPTGGAIRATSQAFTVNAAVAGVVNGLDVGALAAGNWYAIWGISNGATAGGLASLSFSAPAMPAGYTFRKRIGAFLTDGSAHFYVIQQRGNRAQWVVGVNPAQTRTAAQGVAGTFSATSPTLVSVSVAGFVAPTAKSVIVNVNSVWEGNAASSVLVAPSTTWGGTNNGPSGTNGNTFPVYIPGTTDNKTATILLETLSTIAWCSSTSGGALGVLGWEDNLS